MKRILLKRTVCLLLSCICLSLVLSACGGKNSIEGTWKAEFDAVVIGDEQEYTEPAEWVLTFRSDNTGEETFTLGDNKEPKKFTYSLEDGTLKLIYEDKSEKVYSVEYDSDSLTLSESARKVTFERQK